ncbi:ATPase, T2SS/T4P/T4SS family [Nanoarchaeota archaeon]
MPEKPEEKTGIFDAEVIRDSEEVIIRVDAEAWTMSPSIEDNPICMARTVDKLVEISQATRIVFSQKRDYEYDYSQVKLLVDVAKLFKVLVKQKDIFSYQALTFGGIYNRGIEARYAELQTLIFHNLKNDPVGSYVKLRRMIRRENIHLENALDPTYEEYQKKYIGLLNYILSLFEKLQIIQLAKPRLAGYKIGDRDIYRDIFKPIIKPDFMYTKLMATYPTEGEEIDNYTTGDNTEVTIFRFPDTVKYLYHMMPPEFRLEEDKYEILDMARKIMAEHKPTRDEFVNPQRMREVFTNVGMDLIEELVEYKNLKLSSKEIEDLTKILVRYTIGFGLIEVLLQDEKIQDISINSPAGQLPIFIVHGDYDDCQTNIIPTRFETESWASKLRMISGRPLDEANPILDTELTIPGAENRVSTIAPPLNPTGLGFSFRRHRDKPWTLPLFIKYRMINPMAAGLLSFLVDGTRTILIAGTRGSGKSSFLSAMMIEIMRRYRIITVEDTLELPTTPMRKLGFNIQPMKVASALAKGSSEMSASDGIRSTLRLGDSSLIVGEVRSSEAVALYEAMRVGGAANVVSGTIHGDSPFGVYDRVVNDIGVPNTSFKATDIIVVATPIKSADGLRRLRRVTQITEVRKTWEEDPMLEGGFIDLMKYESKPDELQISNELLNGESDILKAIAANIKDYAGNWDAMWENIELRAKLKESLVKYSEQAKEPDLLEAEFAILCNDLFHNITGKVKDEVGSADPKEIFRRWDIQVKREIKKRAIEKQQRESIK